MNDSNSLHNTIKIADAIKNAALVVDKNNKPIYLNTAFITTFNSDKNKTLFEVKNSLQINPEKNCITIEKSEFIYQKLELSNNDNNYFLITIDLQSKKTQNNNYLNQKDILDIIPDIISIHDSQNNIIYFNQAGLNFMGQQQDKLIGKKCYSLINKNQQCNNCPSKECVETGKITEASRYFPELEKWFNIRAYPIKNDKNKVVQIIEHIRDITNQKQNETKLEETQETQIRLIENIPGIVYKCKIDRNWTMLFMSHETKNITGYTPEDFINNKNIAYADIIHPEDKKLVKQNITESIPVDSYFIIEYRIITKTGDIKYVWEKGKAVLKDHNKYIDGVIIDISERKKAEIELAISENKYRLLVQNQNELIVKIDKHGRFTYVSETYCKLFGKTEAELLNKNFMPLVHEEDQQLTNIEISKLSRHPYKCYLEQRALTASGWRWLAWSDKAILNDKNEIVEIIGVGRDITEQKALEFELIKAKQKAENNEKAKINFVINVNTAIKEHIAPMTEMAIKLKNSTIDLLNKETSCSQYLYNTISLESLIEGFSDISLFEQNKLINHVENLDFSVLFNEIFDIISESDVSDNITLIKSYDPKNSFNIYSDKTKIKNILLHLFKIALKQNKNHEITFSFSLINKYIQLIVKYKGEKINLENIYINNNLNSGVAYTNFDAMTYPELTITKLYIDFLGGSMKSENSNNYNQLVCEIPISCRGFTTLQKNAKQGESPDLSNLTILIAEDERINFHLMKTILSKAGATVIGAVSGLEAIEIVTNNNKINLIFMDIKMPGISGVEALLSIKKISPELPVIACTAFTQNEDLESIVKAKFDGFLPKPIRRSDLFEIIHNITNKKA